MQISRRQTLGGAAATAMLLTAPLHAVASPPGRHAFAFQTGNWRVSHRKLVARLAGSHDWVSFGGTCAAWETLDGGGNVEDHFIDDPRGPHRAGAYRMLDPSTGLWSIWWFDPRSPVLSPPVIGRFEGGEGRFYCDDTFSSRPIRVRFIWRIIDDDNLLWEQAFSADGERTWETNWTMEFNRNDDGEKEQER